MCGIAGSFSATGFFTDDDVNKLTFSLAHRGPDGEGFYADDLVKLGHRRLSILDLDARAAQPMQSHNGRYIIVFNGEVYNYIELREQIIQSHKGTPLAEFKTTGDTEVVLRLFEIHGVESIKLLNGMFALAVYDTQLQTLYIFRDCIGIKPLFYYSDEIGNMCFASELKALQKLDKLKLSINSNSVFDFLHTGFIPAPATIYNEILKLTSGCYLKISKQGIEEKEYWSIRGHIKPSAIKDEKQVLKELEELLFSSIQIQLRSDVPYGVFLSGGIDSSLATAIASGLVSDKLNTFSIGFQEQSHNEASHAKVVAQKLNTAHHEFIVSYDDARSMVESYLEIYDEPYADPSGINAMLISRLAAKHVKVVLSGEGGDELFFGYGTHVWAKRLDKAMIAAAKKPMQKVFSNMSSRYQRIASLLDFSEDKVFLPEHIYSQEQYFFNNNEIFQMLSPSLQNNFNTHRIFRLKALHDLLGGMNRTLNAEERQAVYELQFPLQDDLLTKVDRATMHYSIEARVPFLDHRIVEYAFNIHPSLKIKNGIAKYPLKQILYKHLPQELFNRPKQGFSVPLAKWLKKEWAYLIDDYLTEENVNKAGFVKYEFVKQCIDRFRNGDTYLYNRLWNLMVLHRWFLKHG